MAKGELKVQCSQDLYFLECCSINLLSGEGANPLPCQGSSRPQQQHQRTRQVQTSLTPCPFKKWSVYFPDTGKLAV